MPFFISVMKRWLSVDTQIKSHFILRTLARHVLGWHFLKHNKWELILANHLLVMIGNTKRSFAVCWQVLAGTRKTHMAMRLLSKMLRPKNMNDGFII